LEQNFKQLRNTCIQYNLQEACGVLTNYRQWIFTRYDMSKEIFKVVSSAENKLGGKIYRNYNQQSYFEVSEPFYLLSDLLEVKVSELEKIVNILKCVLSSNCTEKAEP